MSPKRTFKNVNAAELLGALGLEPRPSGISVVLGALGTFGLGIVVGAGLALLVAPKPGRVLRDDLLSALGRGEAFDEDLDPHAAQPGI
jgi:hypothetical protein